jgi:spoIIIJ-associated protein
MNNHIKIIKKHSSDLVARLGFEGEAIVTEKDGVVCVNIQMDEPGLLIGKGGEGLEALEHILRLLVNAELESDYRSIILDIAGYRDKKVEYVKNMARDRAFTVLSTGIAETLPPMTSYERRVVHMICTNIADIETESAGEGKDRRVVIKPKKVKS